MFQFHFLIKELTALENVRLPLLKKGTGRLEADERSLQLLNELGLKDKSNRPAYKLSGGEQQRVAIARSFAKFSDTCSLMNPLVIWIAKIQKVFLNCSWRWQKN